MRQDTQKPTKTLTNTLHIPTENLPKPNQRPSKNQPKPKHTKMKTNLLKYPKPMKTYETPITQPQKHPRAKPRPLPANFVEGCAGRRPPARFENVRKDADDNPRGHLFVFFMSETGTPFRLRFIRNPYVSVSYSPHSPHGFKKPKVC